MRVLHCLWDGAIGGAPRAVYQLVREQSRRGDEVGVLFASQGGAYVEAMRELSCPVHVAGARNALDVRCLPRLVRVLRRYDVHHFHHPEPLLFAASALSGRKVRIYTERAGAVHRAFGPRKRARNAAIAMLLHRFCHGFSANTAHAARVAPGRYGLPAGSFRVTYNGIDFALLEPRRERAEVRTELGVAEDRLLVGVTAYLKDWKRIDLLLEAAARPDAEPYDVLVVGDGPERAALERRAQELGLGGRAHFAGMRESVADLVAALDVFVLPSTDAESFGNSVVEAMALGVPSIVFADSPGICEHVEDGATGFVVDGVDTLAQRLGELARDPELRAAVGAAGSRHVRASYGLEQMVESYRELYRATRAR